MPPPLTLRGVRLDPPLFCAPMAGITHSAFRRLVAGFGGYGALFTEMLSARAILGEDPAASPWLKRRPEEGRVVYQLLTADADRLPEVVDRLAPLAPDAIDLNGACPAPSIRQQRGGAELFDDADRLRNVVRTLRRCVNVPLTVKLRLGRQVADWHPRLRDRVRLLADEGVDALTLHPRFSEQKLSRPPRWEVLAEVAADSGLPVIANGDLTTPDAWRTQSGRPSLAAGLMIGRMAAVQPWVFARWHGSEPAIDHAAVWARLFDYIVEDFPKHGQALARVKIFTSYYARNFLFGHTLFSAVQSAPDLETARSRALAFLEASPAVDPVPSIYGI